MWELYALAILDEMKTRTQLKTLSEFGLDILYARAKTKLWSKIERLRDVPGLSVADFGTRRRHSFLWQEYVVVAMAANLGRGFIGTSNAFLAHKHDLEAIGTNAHEIPMVMAALAPDNVALKEPQNPVTELAFVLCDDFIEFLKVRCRDPLEKLLIAFDTFDVDQILGLHAYFGGVPAPGKAPADFHSAADFHDPTKWTDGRRIRFSAGWGTLLTNDFRGCNPNAGGGFDPISLICKVSTVEGRPAVKLSDNYAKALGPLDEVERYRKVFGTAGIANAPVIA
jgi:nicotinate phosphoribosyltransferase